MGKPTGFKEFDRRAEPYRAPGARLLDYKEIYTAHDDKHLSTQGARCILSVRSRLPRLQPDSRVE